MTGAPAGSRVRRLLAPAAVAAAGTAAVLAVAVRDPHVPGSWGTCPVLALVGLPCPGCGGLRAVHDLAHLRPLAALGSNALAVALVVAGVLAWAGWARARWRGTPSRLALAVTDRRVAVGVVLLVSFTLARWLPGAQTLLGP